jgi:hypothetical protein
VSPVIALQFALTRDAKLDQQWTNNGPTMGERPTGSIIEVIAWRSCG